MTIGLKIWKINRNRCGIEIYNDPDGYFTVRVGVAPSARDKKLGVALKDAIKNFKILGETKP